MGAFLMALGLSVGVNAVCFAVAARRRTDQLTDLSYSLSFLLVSLGLAWLWGTADPVRLLAVLLVALWAIRLGTYLFLRILRLGRDARFDGIRERPAAFAQFWLLQALAVPVILLPVLQVLAAPAPRPSLWHGLGLGLWALGFLLETVADAQKDAWKRRGGEGFLDQGLYAWCRYPNYLGEMLVWWGLGLYALPSLAGWGWLAPLGPLAITLVLGFGTGIPPLEKLREARYGHLSAYRAYRDRTPALLPRPPRRA